MRTMVFKSGQQIIKEGEKNKGVFVIQSGRVQLLKSKGSELIELDELGKGEFIGLESFCLNVKENASVKAIGNVSLVELPKLVLDKIKGPKSANSVEKMMSFMASKLNSRSERIKKLQYLDTLHFEKYKKEEMSLYHLKEILRISWVLLLSFNRYNYSISKEYFEDLCSVLIPNMKIRPNKMINLYLKTKIMVEDEVTGNLSLINAARLEYFAQFLLQNFLKNPNKLLLSSKLRDFLRSFLGLRGKSGLVRTDEMGFEYMFKHDIANELNEYTNVNLTLEKLTDKGFFIKEFDNKGAVRLSFEFDTIEEILNCYEIIEKIEL